MRILFFILMCGGIACCGTFACDRSNQPDDSPTGGQAIRFQLAELADLLRAWNGAHGRYPTNDEGLAVLDLPGTRVFPPYRDEKERMEAWTAVRSLGYEQKPAFLRTDAGPVSLYLLPYLYENRRGAPPGVFAHSPVDADPDGLWSRQVDDGIYVLCTDLKWLAEERAAERAAYCLLLLRTAGPALLFGILFAFSTARARRRGAKAGLGRTILLRVGGTILLLGSLLPWAGNAMITCYSPARLSLRHRTAMAAECRRVLTRYREQGMIRPETCQRFLDVLDTDVEQALSR
jgi:hypothetical protein